MSNEIELLKSQRDELLEALEIAKSWIDRCVYHIGNCSGGHECTCGRTRILYDLEEAISIAKGEVWE